MRVRLDERLPAGVSGLLPSHAVTTAQQAGFKGLTNGELLRKAVADSRPGTVTRVEPY